MFLFEKTLPIYVTLQTKFKLLHLHSAQQLPETFPACLTFRPA